MKNILTYWNKKSNHSNNDNTIRTTTFHRYLFMGGILLLLNACDPISRYNRLVNNYPYLVNRQVFDTIHIRDGKTLDTTFIWDKSRDTIVIDGVKLARFRDTFRIYYRERNCTTNLHTTEIRPSKETQIYKEGKGLRLVEKLAIALLFVLLLISLLWKR
jgi:hypothetical protein